MMTARWMPTLAMLVVLSLAAAPLHAEPQEGFEPYLGMKDHFEIALPKGWSVYAQGVLVPAGGAAGEVDPLSTVLFTVQTDTSAWALVQTMNSEDADTLARRQAGQKFMDLMSPITTGAAAAFFLQRLPADDGISCDGFDKAKQERLLEILGEDPMFGPTGTTREQLHADPVAVGGCHGLRVRGKGTVPDGGKRTLDVFVVSDGEFVFMFSLDNPDEAYPKNLVTFEKVMSTLVLTGMRPVADVPGTLADRTLQRSIIRQLFTYASALHEGCKPEVERAERYRDDEPSVIATGWEREGRKRAKRLRENGQLGLERWFVKSCETVDAYEVLIMPSEQGGTDFFARRLESGK